MNQLNLPKEYEVLKREELPDIHAEGLLLRHKKTGVGVVLIPCEDENKVFNIAFRTPPADSTGVAHIIEHTVLCGSEKFPVKDPFVELIKGSLNTFLNALTYPDKTMYPVASTNDADFHNLMHIYLDAVFHPNIYHEQNIFRQEGWHYELESKDAPLTLNGVVYNEMKGVFSSADSVLERETMNALFPDTPYGVESGGDPQVIPELTYDAYLDFHRRYYHPSNSYIYLYGDLDMAEALTFIDAEYLSQYESQPVTSAIPYQKAFEGMHRIEKEYPITEEEDEDGHAYFSWNVVAGDPLDMKLATAFDVLDYALFSAPGAPVRQALIDAGIGSDVYGEFNDGILQPYFSVVAKDADEGDADRFLDVIRRSLEEQAQQGINQDSLIAGLNYLEFQFREADFGSYPKGLMYGMDVMDCWLYDADQPFNALRQLDAFAYLKEQIATGYFENLIKTYMLSNPHSALVILKPKKGLMQEIESVREEKLAKVKAGMSDTQLDEIIDETNALKEWQETPESEENVNKIPMLKRSDLRREIRPLSNIEETLTVKVQDGTSHDIFTVFHEAATNGIVYPELLFNIHHVPAEDIPYLGLLKTVLTNVDTENYSYLELNNEINATTGGMGFGTVITDDPKDHDNYQVFIGIRGKAMTNQTGHLMDLIYEVTRKSIFEDKKRIFEMIAQTKSQLQSALAQAGSQIAAMRAQAYISPAAALNDAISGISYYRFLKDLEENFEEKGDYIAAKLKALAEDIFAADNLMVSFTSEREDFEILRRVLGQALTCGEAKERNAVMMKPLGKLTEAFRTAGQVQFVAMAGDFEKEGYAYSGTMQILRQILSFDYLWQNIRVQGGAYGCSGSMRRGGDSYFTTYRDPHLKRSIDVFRGIPDYLASFEADERTMTKYIIGTMSGVDQPMSPSQYGLASMRAYMSGISEEERQKNRDQILNATVDDIRSLEAPARATIDHAAICVIGGEQAIEKRKELFGQIESLL